MTYEELLKRCNSTIYPEPDGTMHKDLSDLALKFLQTKLNPGASILDIGFGHAWGLQKMRELGLKPVGISMNEEEIRAAKAQDFDVYFEDMHNLHNFNSKFDAVFARHVLEHSPIPLLVLWNISEILVPNGYLYLEVPAPETACKHEKNANHFSVLSFSGWLGLLVKTGFTPREGGALQILTPVGVDSYFALYAQRNF